MHFTCHSRRSAERVWQALTDDGQGSTLVLSNTVANPPHTPYTAAGFHISLSQLTTLLNDGPQAVHRTEMPPPDALVDHYISALHLDL